MVDMPQNQTKSNHKYISVGDHSEGWPEGSLFISYNTEMLVSALLLSLDCFTLPSICTLYWMLSKEASSTIFNSLVWLNLGLNHSLPMAIGELYWYWIIYSISHFLTLSNPHSNSVCPVGWDSKIYWLLFYEEVRAPANECPGYDTKQFDGEVPVMLELWGMWSTLSLPSLPSPRWRGVVAPDKVK